MKGYTLILLGSLIFATNAFSYSNEKFNSVTTPEEPKINLVRDQEIQQIKIVLGRRFAESRRPDIILRLAELYIERYRFYFLKENEIYQGMIKSGMKPYKVDHTKSRENLKYANQYCKLIMKSKVPFDRMDQVYYFLGYNASEMGNDKEALPYFKLVVEKYPKSPNAAEAYREMGEYYYSHQKFKESAFYYEKAAQFENVPSYPRVLYKLAWSKFKIREKSSALKLMKKVTELTGSDEKFVSLKEEAIRDLVYFYAESGDFKNAKDYFSNLSGGMEVYIRSLTILAATYEKEGKYTQALAMNKGLLEEYGDNKPEIAFQILRSNVELYHKMGDLRNEEIALNKMVKYFSEHQGDIASGEDAKANYLQAKSFLRLRVTELHKEAQKKKNIQLFSRSADLYEMYINAFLKDPDEDKLKKEKAEIRIYKTDALLAAGRENDALSDLETTLDDSFADAKLRRESGATLLNILIKKIDSTKTKKEEASQKTEEKFLEVAERFEKAFPNDALVSELKYKRARLEVAKSGPDGLSESARSILIELVQKYPSKPESLDSAQDLVSDLLKKKEEEKAVVLAKSFLSNHSLMASDKKGELKKYFNAIISRQSFQNIKALEGDKDSVRAAVEYEKLAKESQDKEVQFKSLNNAAVIYEQAGKADEAFRIYEKLDKKDELKRLAIQQVGQSRFSMAASLYYRLGLLDQFNEKEKSTFLRSSYLLYRNGNEDATLDKVIRRYLTDHCKKKSTSDCFDIAFDYVHYLIQNDKPQDALNLIRTNLDLKNAEVNFEIAQLYLKMHETNKAKNYLEQTLQLGKKSNSARERNFAAHAAYLLSESLYKQFMSLKLELPEERMKAITKQKLALAEKVAKQYQDIVSIGDGEWGIASLAQLARAFLSFSEEVANSPVPERIKSNPELLKKYSESLSGFAKPFESRAMDFFKQGYNKGIQLGVTAPVFVQLSRDLSRLNPRQFPPAEYVFAAVPEGIVGPIKETSIEALKDINHNWRTDIGSRIKKNSKEASAWIELGNAEVVMKHYSIARLAYEQALQLDGKDAIALNNIGMLIYRDRNYIEAGSALKKAAHVAEFNREIRHNLGQFYLSVRQFPMALDALKSTAARSPDDNEIQRSYGVALLGSSKFNDARSVLENIKAKKSDDFSSWYNWDVLMLMIGDEDEKSNSIDRMKEKLNTLPSEQAKAVETMIKNFSKKENSK